MRSEFMGNLSPVLLSLTGEDTFMGKAKKKRKFLPGLMKAVKKTANVAKWAVPGYAVVKAGQATAKAIQLKQRKNARKLTQEKATAARKLAETNSGTLRAQVEANRAQAEADKINPDSFENIAPYVPMDTAVDAYETESYEDSPEEMISEENASEMEPVSQYEASAEVMGYSRFNDDYFIGAGKFLPGLKTAISKVKTFAAKSGAVASKAGAAADTALAVKPAPQIVKAKTGAGIIDSIKRNPLPYAAAAGAVIFVLTAKKGR